MHGETIKSARMVFTIIYIYFLYCPIGFSNAKFEDFDFPKEVMVNVHLSLFLGNMNTMKVYGAMDRRVYKILFLLLRMKMESA